jgi:hypothetical protein
VRDGRAPIECHVTFTARALAAAGRAANRHPGLLAGALALITVAAGAGVAAVVSAIAR